MHDVLLCIQTKKTVNDQNRLRFDNHFYFKTVDEMREGTQGATRRKPLATRSKLRIGAT